MEIGKRIRQIRAGQSRKVFAQHIGIVENTLRNYEEGRAFPNSDVLSKICMTFKVDPLWLLLGGESSGDLDATPAKSEGETPAPSSVACPRCLELLTKLVQVQEQENALLKENGELKAEVAALRNRLSLSTADSSAALRDTA